jgi:Tfp pilus assembly protein PilX
MNNRGQTLIIVLGIVVVFLISIPVLVFMVGQESRWTVKAKKTTTAFHAAEAGIDRGMWKLKETTANWQTIMDGDPISGYSGTTVYNVAAGSGTSQVVAEYKVNIFQGPNPGEITVRSIGRDASTSEVRGVEVVLTKNAIDSSLSVSGGLTWKPNLEVHWGPVVTFTSIDSSPSQYYPRKFSKGKIEGRDTNPTQLNSDGKEYWAFQNLGTEPQVKLADYRTLAKASVVPNTYGSGKILKKTGSAACVADPPGSGYFPIANSGGKIRLKDYVLSATTCVIYSEGGIDMDNGSFVDVRAIIAEGDFDFNAKSAVYVANVPATAAKEYVKQKEVSAGYMFPGEGSATYNVAGCGMHGFLYCGGNLTNAGGGSIIVGVAKVIGDVTMNTCTIYYDDTVAENIILSDSAVRQVSWKEFKASW